MKKKHKNITFHGYYGFQNTGDDAFLEVCAWATKKYLGSESPLFLGSGLPELKSTYKELSSPKFKGHNRVLASKELMKSNYFISAGGSTFSTHKRGSLKEMALFSQRFNKQLKIGAIGVSIGPFSSVANEREVVNYLKKMDFLAVRDQRSFDYVSTLDLPYNPINAFDLAALLPSVYKEYSWNKDPIKSKKIIGISVCNYESYIGGDLKKESKRNEYLLELIKSLPDSPDVVYRFFYFNGNRKFGDKKITDEFISRLEGKNIEVIDYQNSVYKTWVKISECSFLISTRLHAAIFACYSNVPFVLVEYHTKCSDFLDDIGQPEFLRVGDGECEIESIKENILNAFYKQENCRAINIKNTIIRANKNFEF